MFENLAALVAVSLLTVGTFATFILPPSTQVVSPMPKTQAPTPTPTTTPTPIPTSTPTPTPVPPTPTPTAIPTPTPSPASVISGAELDNFFTVYSGQYGVDRELLRRIALCESSFNTNANYMGYGGMYQFSEGSWTSTRSAMGQNTDPVLRFNAEESVKTAAFKLSQPNGSNAWPSCK